jgi:hypothetical protein
MEQKKTFFQENGKDFIRYEGKPRMIIRIQSFETDRLMMLSADAILKDLQLNGFPFIASTTFWNGSYHLLYVLQFTDGLPPSNEGDATRLAKIMRRLADWYRFTVLMAQSN